MRRIATAHGRAKKDGQCDRSLRDEMNLLRRLPRVENPWLPVNSRYATGILALFTVGKFPLRAQAKLCRQLKPIRWKP